MLEPIFWGAVLTLCIFFPLALLREIKSLQYLGLIGFFFTLYFVALVAVEFFVLVEPGQRSKNFDEVAGSFDWSAQGILASYPIFIYSFSFQINLPPVNSRVKNSSTRRMAGILCVVFAILFAIYGLFGTFGVLTQAHESEYAKNILRAEIY